MALPTDLPTITVTATYKDYLGNPATGRIIFEPSGTLIDQADKLIVTPQTITAVLDLNGAISVSLIATDTTVVNPTGFTYCVKERIHGLPENVYYIQLPGSIGSTVDLTAAPRVPGPANLGSTPTSYSVSVTGMVNINGDNWFLTNAVWDGTANEFFRIDKTKAAYGLQTQASGYLPGEPDIGFFISGSTLWVAQPADYTIIRGGGTSSGKRYGETGGWELGYTLTQQRQMTVGGGGIEIDGYGTTPYGRVINNTTGSALARRVVGMVRNAFTGFDGYDDPAQDSWYWGYVEQYDAGNGNATVAGSPHWTIARIPANSSPTSGVFEEYLTVDAAGEAKVTTDPTAPLGIATKQYVDTSVQGVDTQVTTLNTQVQAIDARVRGGEAFFNGDGTTTSFFVAHGLGTTPSRVHLTALNQASLNCWYTKDGSNIGINYASPPANGATIAVSWSAYR